MQRQENLWTRLLRFLGLNFEEVAAEPAVVLSDPDDDWRTRHMTTRIPDR
jgi:hypothetical protein